MDTHQHPDIVGTYSQGTIGCETNGENSVFHFLELVSAPRRDLQRKCVTRKKSIVLNSANSYLPKEKEVIHASIQYLEKLQNSEKDNLSRQLHPFGLNSISNHVSSSIALFAIVWKEVAEDNQFYYSSSVALIEERIHSEEANPNGFNAEGTLKTDIRKIQELMLVNKFDREFHAHLLPPHQKPSGDSETDILEGTSKQISSFVNRIVILNLDENVIQFNIETFPCGDGAQPKMMLLESEMVTRCFWWAQWVPQYQFLAFAHDRKVQLSTFDDEEIPQVIVKPMLSVLQFHNNFPRESVLNTPLDIDTATEAEQLILGKLIYDPNIITSKSVNLKICAHASGAVYVFSLCQRKSDAGESRKLKYRVNLLHHNKTLTVEYDLSNAEASMLPVKIDVAIFANDQYLAVVGWPFFVQLLDVGVTHEPSHHITLDFTCFSFLSQLPLPNTLKENFESSFSLIMQSEIANPSGNSNTNVTVPSCDDKLSQFSINLVMTDMKINQVAFSPAKLHQLLEKKVLSLNTKLALIHYILVHVGDVNVCKRIIYDEGKKLGNLNLTKVYQEFIVGVAYAQTKKQLLPTMEQFLSLIPYCPQNPADYNNGNRENPSIEVNTNRTEVCTMLLSPSQRVFPHNVTDQWTSLWHMNKQLARSNRFCHKNVADKLLLALQCYKPEALSKASTPMSPSSPMVCASLGDIAGLFGRRATELQLPFVEHESCTANKQEYIFSINLRELSMHLLKERKEYPLLGHTVAGKYVSSLVDTARLLCHLACLTVHLQPTKNRDKGFRLIDCLEWETKLRLFMLLEHYSLALGTLACPLPQGFTPFFAYLAYKTLNFDQFIWHVRAGTFELQIDLVKTIMADLKDSDQESVSRKLRLLSLLPKSRAYRILNSWSHPVSVSLRARQHSSDLLSGTVSQARKSTFASMKKKKPIDAVPGKTNITALDSFFQLLTGKANANDIDLGLLTEATMLSMEQLRD